MPNTWENNALYTHYKVSTISGRSLDVKTASGVSLDVKTASGVSLDVRTASGVSLDVKTASGVSLATTEGFSVPAYDYISLTYSGSTLTGVVYKTGGSGGTTLATLVLAYDGSNNLTSVTKS